MKKYISECIHLVKIAPLPGAIVDSSGYIVACNQFLKKDFLLSDDSISFGALLSPIDLDEFMKFLNEVRKFGYYQTELTFVNKVKKMVYARHIKSLNIFLVFIVSQEYKTKFSNLLNKFNVLFNNLDCGILITDRKMKIINFNISAKQILELSEVNLKNSYVPFLSKRKIKKIKNIINEHDLFEGQCHYKTTDNKDLILNVKCI